MVHLISARIDSSVCVIIWLQKYRPTDIFRVLDRGDFKGLKPLRRRGSTQRSAGVGEGFPL